MKKRFPKRFPHNLSHRKDFTMDMGSVIPFHWGEVLPGDTFQASTTALIKCNQLLAQIQTAVTVKIIHGFIPYRLIWDDSEEFFTGGEDGMSVFNHPAIAPGAAVAESSLFDYLGVPPGNYGVREFNALPIRAYTKFVNQYFIDQDLMTPRVLDTASGSDTTTDITLAPALWSKDYFSAARPFTQRGDDLTIPLGSDSAPVKGIGNHTQTYPNSSGVAYETDGIASTTYASFMDPTATNLFIEEDPDNSGYPNIRVDMAAATGMAVDDFRLTIAMQRMYERMGSNGYRYSDYLNSLGLPSSDARLNQPEILGIGKNTIQFSEVLSSDGANTGDEYGHGVAAMRTNKYRRYFEEHGIQMSFMVVMPKPSYAQCMQRAWFKTTKEDYFIPELQHIGEQVIQNQEAYSLHSSPESAWGYLPRYEEYRGLHSTIAGEMRTTLNHTHMARIYSADVALNDTWLETAPTKRIFGAPGTHSLKVLALNNIRARRLVSPLGRAKTL